MTIQEAVKFAVEHVLDSFKEAENPYEDYKHHEGFTDEQYDEMLETLRLFAHNGPYRQAVIDAACDIQEQSDEGADREMALNVVVDGFRNDIARSLPPMA